MDATQPPSRIQQVIWSAIAVVLVAHIAYTTQPPCDKPINTYQRAHAEEENTNNQVAAMDSAQLTSCWHTAQGDAVSYLFKPTASACTLILVLKEDSADSKPTQQTLAIKLSGNNNLLPDTQAIKPLMQLLETKYTLNALHITIEGAIEEQKARDIADSVSLVLH